VIAGGPSGPAPAMICQNCQKNLASVHVTEIVEVAGKDEKDKTARKEVHEQHLCEICAASVDLPHSPSMKKSAADIWKLLQMSAQQNKKRGGPSCPDCGMSLDEFRKKGRLGCARDYEVFKNHIGDLLERVHGARAHVGRVPGTSEADSLRSQRLSTLKQQLEQAIRTEAYESAARLRDEIKALDQPEAS
jgi:protein arginine kinase activator